MATGVKVSIVGAGSSTFSLALVKDLCLTAGLAGSQVCFMDVDPDRLDVVHRLAPRYAAELGADLRFERTLEREVALRDADFVVNTAYAKGHFHARDLRALTARHGYYYGRVGLYRYHDLQLMMDVARDMERLCPDAWLIQAGNPVFQGCTLMTRETGLKVCGLCHGHYGYLQVARIIGIEHPERVTWQAPGLNHNIWLTHFLYEGQDCYPLLDRWIETEGEKYWRTHVATETHDVKLSRAAVHQYCLYGLLPIGDTVRRGGWWYHSDVETKKHWYGQPWGGPDTEEARSVYVEGRMGRIAEMARLAADPHANLVEALGAERTREQHVPIIDALVNGHEGQFQVNVPNRGALAGLPDDVVVEVPAVVNRKGIQPLRVGSLPRKIMLECILPEWLQMERELEAFLTGDRSMLLWGVLESHQTRSYEQAVDVLDDIMAMEGHEEMDAHYRWPAGW
jgi:alpha-galactosidase